MSKEEFGGSQRSVKSDLLSGLTVALALVPEAIAFAFIAGVSPIIGLYSAVFIGLITAILGGRPGMISGATGAMAVVVVSLIAIHGVEYLFPAIILCGVLQIAVGLCRLGVLIRMVPHPVMIGFVNGLAIVIGMAQIGNFRTVSDIGQLHYMTGPSLWIMLGLVALTMLIIRFFPKLNRSIPASLVAILAVSAIGIGANRFLPPELAATNQVNVVMNVGDMLATHAKHSAATSALKDVPRASLHERDLSPDQKAVAKQAIEGLDPKAASINAGFPKLVFLEYVLPPLALSTLWIILPYSIVLAAVGLIESLMTMTLIDEITETRGNSNRECVGQGIANVTCGLFGGMGGCAMVGQSLINVKSGGRGRLSGAFAACALLAFILFFSTWIEMIPIAALVGVMFMVVIGTFEWATFKLYRRIPLSDFLVILIVTLYTAVMHDLAGAVVIGVILSALNFAFKHAKNITAKVTLSENGTKVYQVHGPLFFASTTQFKELFDPRNDPSSVEIDFYYTRVYDHSGMEAIHSIAKKYQCNSKSMHLTHLSPECRTMLEKAKDLIDISISDESGKHLANDRLAS